jgi:diaminohydroxyphosphoribosylaminopyrimidine deaminase / 5-amino-6-(5-phosphoribosylamino)uracil reductase
MASDEEFMTRALELAARGRGSVEPNPMVGAVIVRDGREIAAGYHTAFGQPHAEVEAIHAARAAGTDVAGATMVVTLEPCCHHGKTGPCTEAILAAGIARVVAAMEDPDARVAGKGLAALKAAGVEVAVGCGEAAARRLLAAYIKLRARHRPWVTGKWAQTADGAWAWPSGPRRWITGPDARSEVHRMRSLSDAVGVGIGTVLADDPLLTNRSGAGRQGVRLVLDSRLRIPADSQLLQTAREFPLLIATTPQALTAQADRAEAMRHLGAEIVAVPAGAGGLSLTSLLEELGGRQWTHLLIEGGPTVMRAILAERLADELCVFVSPATAGADASLPRLDIAEAMEEFSLPSPTESRFGEDSLRRFLLG